MFGGAGWRWSGVLVIRHFVENDFLSVSLDNGMELIQMERERIEMRKED